MKLDFHAHISHLGFDGVYPNWIKESKDAININKLHIGCTMHRRSKKI
jgi:hypothetical protein